MILLNNANIFTNRTTLKGFLVIKDSTIYKIGEGDLPESSEIHSEIIEIIDCKGALLLPGFIDSHVHLRDFEQSHKETISSGSLGALVGGTTTILAMPNTSPSLSSSKRIEDYKAQIIENKETTGLYCNVGFFNSIRDNFQLEDQERMKISGSFGIKIYPKDRSNKIPLKWGEEWHNDMDKEGLISFLNDFIGIKFAEKYAEWKILFEHAKKHDLPVLFHPELLTSSKSLVKGKRELISQMKKEGFLNPKLAAFDLFHPIDGNERANIEMIIIMMHSFFPNPANAPHIHFCHVSSSECVEIINKCLKDWNYSCSIEVTPHHLLLNYESIFSHESLGKVLTPLRSPEQQGYILNMLQTKEFDIIATDHAPHTLGEKKDHGFEKAPPGLPNIDFAPRILLSEVFNYKLALDTLIDLYCETPAKIFKIRNKGFIKEGYDADLILVEKVTPYEISTKHIMSKQKWNPFEGRTIEASISKAFIDGNLCYDSENNIINPRGRFLSL